MHAPLRLALCSLLAATALTACSHSQPVQSYEFTGDRFATWTDEDPGYRLFPGDELDIVVYAAPELSRTILVAPDGRLLMPYAKPIMAGNKTIRQVERELSAALAGVVKNPDVQITPKTFQSQKIFIGGEVRNPGSFDMPGQIDVLQALTMAGGATERAKPKQALLIRRSPDGRPMMRVIDVASGLKDVRQLSNIPLQRFDILYVPRSPLANAGIVMDQVRSALPITFGTYYSLNGN
jgi:polysaccharide export outer membrane protein